MTSNLIVTSAPILEVYGQDKVTPFQEFQNLLHDRMKSEVVQFAKFVSQINFFEEQNFQLWNIELLNTRIEFDLKKDILFNLNMLLTVSTLERGIIEQTNEARILHLLDLKLFRDDYAVLLKLFLGMELI